MNYLFHLYLAGDDPELLTGSFAGDFVKGRLEGAPYPPRIVSGVDLHRRTDSFAEKNPHFVASKKRLSPHLGLYRSVLVDLFYDHFLASTWSDWSAEPLARYLDRTREVIERRRSVLPQALQQFLPVIFEQLLPSYSRTAGIDHALSRMAQRVRRSNPLAGAGVELIAHYDLLREDFRCFVPEVQHFALDLINRLSSTESR